LQVSNIFIIILQFKRNVKYSNRTLAQEDAKAVSERELSPVSEIEITDRCSQNCGISRLRD